MRKMLTTMLMVFAISGCTAPNWSPPPPEMIPIEPTVGPVYPNPVLIPLTDPQCAWEAIVDVIDDYFKIKREEQVRQVGDMLTEGRIETFAQVSPTLLEPWRRDTAGEYDHWENTLQTMRRHAVVRVLPAEGGYWVDVAVFKELEDPPQPEHASAGAATFRYDSAFSRVVNPSAGEQVPQGWIPKGRDPLLEQQIIGHLISNCNELGYSVQPNGSGFGVRDVGF